MSIVSLYSCFHFKDPSFSTKISLKQYGKCAYGGKFRPKITLHLLNYKHKVVQLGDRRLFRQAATSVAFYSLYGCARCQKPPLQMKCMGLAYNFQCREKENVDQMTGDNATRHLVFVMNPLWSQQSHNNILHWYALFIR